MTTGIKTYTHGAEDLWLMEQFPAGFKGYACEVGACDGVHKSNTLLLEEAGWTVLCIEPNPRHREALKARRKLNLFCACDHQSGWETLRESGVPHWTKSTIRADESAMPMGQVPVLTLDQCLAVVGFPRLDVLSLDVDGIENDILRAFSLDEWRPHAIVLEAIDADSPALQRLIQAGYRDTGEASDWNHLLIRD